ncbi:putative multiple epidermal growth factor-like domains protein 8 [Apostichopus japonicus]|uniref:Putative multiple epidermal growth factor-like domains protein 8 n=1 Tax=Stichopus japonicus TaxID=307972 RepID=A0A2G8JH33_STIJA|nr:putative multiple epidermal growth factor-like domains protein 8 [Apostichopus japonicus]
MYSLRDVSPEHIEIETSPPNPCPQPCHTHLTCTECLDSDGADGGRSSCVWSSPLQQCMSPNYLYLHCTTGLCGLILYGDSDLCPVPCSAITHCDSCLRQVNCGWCSVGFNATKGVCLPGNISSPVNAVCRNNDVSGSTDIPAELTDLAMTAEAVWHYLTCPPENECHNGDYTCSENEQCQDTPESYICICMDGYNRNSDGVCSPVCSSTCEYGICVAPDTCQCDFGYVGDTCSDKCNCNNHSACPGPDSLDVCTECLHNTMGANCEYCKTFHVGNASNGEDCTPCRDICNSNSDFCISYSNDENWQSQHGPLSAVDVKCLNCTNNSQGDRCESCQEGFFWKDETSCEPCECNGHSDSCDAATGMGCTCNNHTRSPPCPSDSYAEPCYRHQCSVCTDQEVFKGNPTKGHQCYRLVEVAPRCFGINNEQSECTGGSELPPGRSTLFVIKPSFMDLDIRVTIDVTVGSLDVYISHEPDMFVIVSDGAGRHRVMIDGNKNVDRTDLIPLEESSRMRREAMATLESGPVPYINKVTSHTAAGLNSFVTIDDVQFVTVIRNAENRLIVTIPHRIHDLKIKWFYFLLLATDGTTPERTDTPGALIYRQDIPEIDLFIFFSAFLSSFFKLLAILIAVWKLKVSWEARQAARARSLEMEHRRSRPFGHVVVFMEEVADPLPVQPVHPSRRTKRKSPRSRRSTPSGRSRHGPITPRLRLLPKPFMKSCLSHLVPSLLNPPMMVWQPWVPCDIAPRWK